MGSTSQEDEVRRDLTGATVFVSGISCHLLGSFNALKLESMRATAAAAKRLPRMGFLTAASIALPYSVATRAGVLFPPTAALAVREVNRVLDLISRQKSENRIMVPAIASMTCSPSPTASMTRSQTSRLAKSFKGSSHNPTNTICRLAGWER